MKVAVTDLTASIVTIQVPIPEHPSPLQPPKVVGAIGIFISVTVVL